MPTQSSANIAPGQGAALELLKLAGQNIYVPSSALRAVHDDDDAELGVVTQTPEGELIVKDAAQNMRLPPRALQYARDTVDRMRVSVDVMTALIAGTATIGNVALTWGLRDTYPLWYTQGAPGSMDARETQREMSLNTFQTQRSRWTIT